eukprot:SAG31_NODE_14293_length_816_cov_1.001395_2_plen_68_part_01
MQSMYQMQSSPAEECKGVDMDMDSAPMLLSPMAHYHASDVVHVRKTDEVLQQQLASTPPRTRTRRMNN